MAQSPDSGKRGGAAGAQGKAAAAAVEFALDRQNDVPLGTQLAWKLRGAIAAGRLVAGERLPPVRELAGAAGVNVNTVRAVYGRLAEQGLIVSEHGRGTFVADALADSSELRELAQRTADEASRHGVDPRELAAVLYAQPATAGSRPAGGAGGRQLLRTRIGRLERELAELDQELTLLDEQPAQPPAPAERRRGGARVLALDELEAVYESLAMQVAERRVQLQLARERGRRGGGPRTGASHSVATQPPELVVGAGTWTLRWRA